MSYIPNVREKYIESLYKNTKGSSKEPELNPYWEKLLDKDRETFLDGYDESIDTLDNCFINLDVYEDLFKDANINIKNIDYSIITNIEKNYDEYTEEEINNMSLETKMIFLIRSMIFDYLERNRDEIVVSLIDDMNDDEYEQMVNYRKNLEEENNE